jgi:dienelactone hydrolase
MTLMAGLAALGCSAAPAQGPVSREISFKVPDMTLQGTFEAPSGASKAPALLLIPGSGPTDRDGNSNLLTVKIDLLKDVADELAKNGVASLRFDKRAIAHYKDFWPKTPADLNAFFAWHKFVDDAKAALTVLESQPEVDPGRVGLLGHSEGSLISLQVGSDLNGTKGEPKVLVLLASTGRPMGAILHEQIARALKIQGASPEVAKPLLDYTDSACKALAAGQPLPPNTPQGLAALFNPTVLDIMGAYCRIDPTDLAKNFHGPVLVMTGQHDSQVSAERDTPRLVAALKTRGGAIEQSFIIPDASHCLKSTKGGNDDVFDGPLVPGVLDDIIAFVKANL